MDELREMLEKVSDSYGDFVDTIVQVAKDGDGVEEITNYLMENPDADTSEIIRFVFSDVEVVDEEDDDVDVKAA